MSRVLSHPLLAGLLIVLATGLAYGRAADSAFQYDDHAAVIQAVPFLDAGGLAAAWSRFPNGRPLTQTLLAFDAWRSGMGPDAARAFHMTNLLLHLAACGLLYRILVRLLGPGGAVGAAFGTLVFALHPLQAQAAAYVINRSSILAAIGTLAAVLMLLRSREGGWPWIAGALVAWLLGLAGKETAAAMPLLGLIALHLAARAAPSSRDATLRRLLLGALALEGLLFARTLWLEWTGPLPTLAFARTQLWVVPNYLRLALWPWPQSVVHETPDLGGWGDPRLPAVLAFWGLALPAAGLAMRHRPVLAAALAWTAAALLPEASIVPLDERMMEHRMYLALGGAALAAGFLAPRLLALRPRAAGAWILLLGGATLARGEAWADPRVLWREACRVSPAAPKAWINLGQGEVAHRRLPLAAAWTHRALRIRPDDPEAVLNLGAIAADRGDREEAARRWRTLPDHPTALFGLGNLLQEDGNLDAAEPLYERAVMLSRRTHFKSLNALGTLKAERGDPEGARALFEECLARRTDYFEAWLNLGQTLASLRRPEEALLALDRARSLAPDDPGANLALGRLHQALGDALWFSRPTHADADYDLASCGTLTEAARKLEAVLQRHPDEPSVLKARELLQDVDRHWVAAAEAFQRAAAFPASRSILLTRRKDLIAAEALERMGSIASLRGQLPEAILCLRRALELNPDNARIRTFLEAMDPVSDPGPAPAAP